MKLRKMIPAVFMTVIALLLSVTLFSAVIPAAQAMKEAEELREWNRIESGYVYGADRAIYRYCYSMEFGTYADSFTNEVTPAAILRLEVDENADVFKEKYIVVDELIYLSEIDEYIEKTRLSGGGSIGYRDAISLINFQMNYEGEMMDAEVVEITAWYCLDGRVVASLTWNKEAMTK